MSSGQPMTEVGRPVIAQVTRRQARHDPLPPLESGSFAADHLFQTESFAAKGTGPFYALSNTMSHSYFKTPASGDSTSLHIVKAGSRDRARIVESRASLSLRASPGKYICATRR